MLEVIDASFSYERLDVFKNINFRVNEGEIFCIVGPNGCGKTTLLDCLLGILRLKRGEILLNKRNIKTTSPGETAKQLAYVPQLHEKTFPYSVIDIVLMGRAAHIGLFSAPSSRDVAVAEEALELVGLTSFKDRPYTQLSGGEAQLVLLARALAQKTKMIIMDEPTAHLDFKNELTVLETIVQLVSKTGLSIIMATHFPNHAFYFENNSIDISVALMSRMTFSAVGSPSEILSEDNLKSIYSINAKVVSHRMDNDSELRQIIPISTVA
jgi:iron complex transport system ATP-binding protein